MREGLSGRGERRESVTTQASFKGQGGISAHFKNSNPEAWSALMR